MLPMPLLTREAVCAKIRTQGWGGDQNVGPRGGVIALTMHVRGGMLGSTGMVAPGEVNTAGHRTGLGPSCALC